MATKKKSGVTREKVGDYVLYVPSENSSKAKRRKQSSNSTKGTGNKKNSKKGSNGKLIISIMVILLVFVTLVGYSIFFGIGTIVNNHYETVEVGTPEYEVTPQAHWLFIDLSDHVEVSGDLDLNTVGSYELKYYLFGRTYRKYILVRDTTSPVITLEGAETVTVQKFDDFVEPGYSASDNVDGDVTKQVETSTKIIDTSTYIIEYSVKDSNRNVGTAQRTVKIAPATAETESQTIICLTFDDGPSGSITPQVLDILEANNIQATFFVVGYNDTNAEYILRAYEDGNTIGLHGMSHKYADIYTSIDTLMENFNTLRDKVSQTTGESPIYIRFPGGSSNTVSKKYCEGIMTVAAEEVTNLGYVYYDWNVDSDDAGQAVENADAIYQNVVSGIIEGRTNVVLMHDSSNHQATVDALQKIIDDCIAKGYSFKAIDENTPVVHHQIAN